MTRLPIRILLLPAAALLTLPGPARGSENPCFCNGLAIYAYHPAQPFLVDPLGRRLGADPEDGVFHNEMGAFYSVGEPSRTILPTLRRKREPHPEHYIHMRPMSGEYRIQAVGVDTGAYRLEVTAIRGDCTRDTTVWQGRTQKGKVDVHRLVYRDGSGDTVPPATRIDYTEGTWLNRPRSAIRLWAEDSCSGPAKTWVKAEGGVEVEPGVLEIRKEGLSSLEYWSVDNAGNEEARRKLTVRCDYSPPRVVHDYAGGRIVVGPVAIRFSAFDSVSGRADVKVRVRHREEYVYSGNLLRLSEPGTYNLRYNAVDPAGNWSEMKTLALELRKPPWYRRWFP